MYPLQLRWVKKKTYSLFSVIDLILFSVPISKNHIKSSFWERNSSFFWFQTLGNFSIFQRFCLLVYWLQKNAYLTSWQRVRYLWGSYWILSVYNVSCMDASLTGSSFVTIPSYSPRLWWFSRAWMWNSWSSTCVKLTSQYLCPSSALFGNARFPSDCTELTISKTAPLLIAFHPLLVHSPLGRQSNSFQVTIRSWRTTAHSCPWLST